VFAAANFLRKQCLIANGGCPYLKPLSEKAGHDLWIINFMKIASPLTYRAAASK
jgi:hypothetical protein